MVGTGIFTTSGLILENLHHPLLMTGLWALVGLVALSGAFSYAELSTAMPYAGGEYVYLTRLFHPAAGFLSGWISFIVGFSAPVAAAAVGMSEYLLDGFPQLQHLRVGGWQLQAEQVGQLLAVAVVVVFTLVHLQGVRIGSRIHNAFTIIKFALLLGIIAAGLIFGEGSWERFNTTKVLGQDSGWQAFGLSVLWVSFAYTGWNAAAYIASEVKSPRKNLPKALITGAGIVIVLYVMLNILFVYAVPPAELEGTISVGSLAAKHLFGEGFSRVFAVFVAVALFSSISALIILGPRIYYAMAKEGHFFRFAAQTHPRTGVPHISVIIQGAVAILIVLSGSFSQILSYMGFALGIFPILAVSGVFVLRRRGLTQFRAPWHPVMPVFFIGMNVFMLAAGFSQRPVESGIALATVLAGAPLYMLFKRNQKGE